LSITKRSCAPAHVILDSAERKKIIAIEPRSSAADAGVVLMKDDG